MKLPRRTVLGASVATPGSSPAAPAVKASPGWPTKAPIKLIATFPPGRTQVVAQNKPGGLTHVHTSDVLIVPADSPCKTLADYIVDTRVKPDQIAFGSSGIGSNTHPMGELLPSLAGIKLKHVPYRGSAPSLQDMLAGTIPSMFDPITTNVPHINSGKVRLLAINSEQRIEIYPAAPTFAGQAFPKLTTSTWAGVPGRKGMAPEIVARLYEELQKTYKAPEVVERFKDVVPLPGDKPMSPAEHTRFVGNFAAIWSAVSKSAGIELELG